VAWVDEVCTRLASATGQYDLSPDHLVLCSLSTARQLNQIAGRVQAWPTLESTEVLVTLADGVGPAAITALMRWFDAFPETDLRQRLLRVVTHLPTDEAMQALIDRLDQRTVVPALAEMSKRFPRRAL